MTGASSGAESPRCAVCDDPTGNDTTTPSGDIVCPLCEHFYEQIVPVLAVEEVLTFGSSQSRKYHLPGENGEPLCGIASQKNRATRPKDTSRKDPAVLPHHDVCQRCANKLNHGVTCHA